MGKRPAASNPEAKPNNRWYCTTGCGRVRKPPQPHHKKGGVEPLERGNTPVFPCFDAPTPFTHTNVCNLVHQTRQHTTGCKPGLLLQRRTTPPNTPQRVEEDTKHGTSPERTQMLLMAPEPVSTSSVGAIFRYTPSNHRPAPPGQCTLNVRHTPEQ